MSEDLPIPDAAVAMVRELYALVPGEQSIGEAAYAKAIGAPVAAAVLRAFDDHADTEFNGEDRSADYARGVLDAARNARRRADRIDPQGPVTPAPSPDALGDPEGAEGAEGAEEAVVARDRARQGAELHGGAGWTRQSGEEEGT